MPPRRNAANNRHSAALGSDSPRPTRAANGTPTLPPRTPVVLYTRVSSKDQEKEGFSIPSQEKLLRGYADDHAMRVVGEYSDVETAKKAGRTNFSKMIAYLKKHPDCRTIIVEKTDRLYRNLKDWVELDAMNLEIHLVKENIVLSEGSRSHEKFIHGIKVLMAKNYIDNLSEETKKGMLEKAAQGIWPGAAPLGYVNVTGPHGKRIIDVDPVAGPLVSKMFELYANGEMSVKALATWAKANGLPFKRSHAEVPVSSVHRMLCNLLYTGEYSWDGTLYQGTHKPLVTRELWERVQDKMQGRNPYSRHDTKLSFAFSGLVRCGTCIDAGGSENRLLIGEIQKQKYIYYHCAGCAHQKRATYIKEEVLDAQMQQALRSLHVDDEVMQMVRDGLRGSHEDEQRCHQEATQRLYKQHEALQRRIDMAYDDRLDGRITAEMFERKATEWRAEQARVRRELERHENANQTYIDQGMALLEVANRAAEMYVGRTPDQKRRMLNFVLLNSTWRDGKLEVEWREPFNLLAKSIAECKSENASSVVTGGVRSQWLPLPDLNRGPSD
jgi:site-specific DNA recombinase